MVLTAMNKDRIYKGKSLIGFPQEYCIVDIETTGLNAGYDDIIEIGAIKYVDGVVIDTFDSLLQPKCRHYHYYVSRFITELTGITNAMLEQAPPSEEVLFSFQQFLGDSIIVGYNVNFDVNFLYDSFLEYLGAPMTNDFIDILRMARKLFPSLPHHRLSDMTAYYGLVNEHAHRALSDCEVTAQCFERFEREASFQYGSTQSFINTYPPKCRLL